MSSSLFLAKMAGRKVLITGTSGLLGRAVVEEFSKFDDKWKVIGVAYSRVKSDLVRLDLRDEADVTRIMMDVKPDVIIHCAAERRPDIVEKQEDLTYQLNVAATSYLAKCAYTLSSYLIYISTDYVFDGTNPPYKPTDGTNPLNKYGESKLRGEEEALNHAGYSAVLRVPILYGKVETLHESAVTGLFDLIRKCVIAKVSDYERRRPTSVDDVAIVCRQMCEKHLNSRENCTGIYHWSGDEEMTKYEMVKVMGEIFGLPTNDIVGDRNPVPGAKRPYNSTLDCSDLEKMGIGRRTTFRSGIKACLEPFFVIKRK